MEEDNLLTRTFHCNAHTIKDCAYFALERSLVLKKNANMDMGEPSRDGENHIIMPSSKEKSGAPGTCSLEVSSDIFKEIF